MSQQFYFYTHNPKKMKLPRIKDIYTPMDTAANKVINQNQV